MDSTIGTRKTRRRSSAMQDSSHDGEHESTADTSDGSAVAVEQPTVPVVAPRRIAAAKRHAMGRAHLASVVNWWLAATGYSHSKIEAIANWSLGVTDVTWLRSSQLSHIRNAHNKQPSFVNLEALASANEAIAMWHMKGRRATFRYYGPFDDPILKEALLDQGIWLKHPKTGHVLTFADLCDLCIGKIRLPQITAHDFVEHDAKKLSDELGFLLDDLAESSGLTPRDAIANVLLHYPSDDRARVERLKDVMLGTHVYSSQEVREELYALAELVRTFRGLPEGAYGPEELLAELTKSRRRT